MRNHLGETLAIDFAVVPTATFGILYVFFVLSLERRRVLHFNVTKHPTAEWTAQQVVEVCAFELPGRFLIRDNDRITGPTSETVSMASGSSRYARRFDPLGRTDLQSAGSAVFEGIAWSM